MNFSFLLIILFKLFIFGLINELIIIALSSIFLLFIAIFGNLFFAVSIRYSRVITSIEDEFSLIFKFSNMFVDPNCNVTVGLVNVKG
tara:strand:+ start:461 stop:721 length:261 start_codon:yes stop_codon:yes gene_type:complete